ncbi:MAG TPA: serine/threonine-protein kinase, partial [Woeseiaceae bacterium]|nr:serine/threonine-protein kinase [Woeseiaceae bacterium]
MVRRWRRNMEGRDDAEYEMEVAIKLVPAVIDRDELMRRFKAERQIMASLEHPNIARLLDGDTTRDGVPYVVMEYVQGVPIDQYCSDNALGIDERLELFQQVCAAINHAHKNLIIHRDIKPGNILVTAEGVPKLLDFGIAKILDTNGPLAGSLTRSSMRMMTPEYASPEQVRGETINTASDVYSLGVLLHKLLTDSLPYDLDIREFGAFERIICEQEPRKPSSINPAIGSELDAIVMMALRKEPARRYPSVEAFTDDLKRLANDQPIAARPDTTAYRVHKFVKRNRLGVIATSAVVIAIAGLVAFYTARLATERDIATAEAEKAKRVAELLGDVMQVAGPEVALGETITAQDLLKHGIERAREKLVDEPEVLAEVLTVALRTYGTLDMYDVAYGLAEETVALRREFLPPNDPRLGESLYDLAIASWSVTGSEEAEAAFEEALQVFVANFGDEPNQWRAATQGQLSLIYFRTQRDEQGKELIDKAVATMYELFPDGGEPLAETINTRQYSEMRAGDTKKAIETGHELIDMRRKIHGDKHPMLAHAIQNTAHVYYLRRDLENAEKYTAEAIEMYTALFSEDAVQLTPSIGLLAEIQAERGDYARGIQYAERYNEIMRRRFPDPNTVRYWALQKDLSLYLLGEQYERVVEIATERMQALDSVGGINQYGRKGILERLFAAYIGLEDADAAEDVVADVIERGYYSPDDDPAWLRLARANIMGLRGDYDGAIALYHDVEKTDHPNFPPTHLRTAKDYAKLALLYEKAGDIEQSRNYFTQALEIFELSQVPGSPRLREVRAGLTRLESAQ